jgi:hypothetical protein
LSAGGFVLVSVEAASLRLKARGLRIPKKGL